MPPLPSTRAAHAVLSRTRLLHRAVAGDQRCGEAYMATVIANREAAQPGRRAARSITGTETRRFVVGRSPYATVASLRFACWSAAQPARVAWVAVLLVIFQTPLMRSSVWKSTHDVRCLWVGSDTDISSK